ncbi:hypothetical protein CDEF62S_05867 [Castellaniella defragrans]
MSASRPVPDMNLSAKVCLARAANVRPRLLLVRRRPRR